jgi:hypothetical protein
MNICGTISAETAKQLKCDYVLTPRHTFNEALLRIKSLSLDQAIAEILNRELSSITQEEIEEFSLAQFGDDWKREHLYHKGKLVGVLELEFKEDALRNTTSLEYKFHKQ